MNYNLGTEKGHSVIEVINTVEEVNKKIIKFKIMPKRRGDPPELVAKVGGTKQTLKWQPIKPTLIEQIEDAWKWHQIENGR